MPERKKKTNFALETNANTIKFMATIKTLALRGDKENGALVIKALEFFKGDNPSNYDGTNEELYYYNDDEGKISTMTKVDYELFETFTIGRLFCAIEENMGSENLTEILKKMYNTENVRITDGEIIITVEESGAYSTFR